MTTRAIRHLTRRETWDAIDDAQVARSIAHDRVESALADSDALGRTVDSEARARTEVDAAWDDAFKLAAYRRVARSR